MPMLPEPDIVVIGGGPIGCAAALAFARAGQRVWIVEQAPDACHKRFAGEWLHPRGLDVLSDLTGWDAPPFVHATMPGFIVKAPGHDPVTLPYLHDAHAIGFDHGALVEALRARLHDWNNIHYIASARATVDGSQVHISGAVERVVTPDRVIVAAGRAGARMLQCAPAQSVSVMGGIVVDLPERDVPEHAQVILGGPGPILIYRIGLRRVRISIDLPAALRSLRRQPQLLSHLLEPFLPSMLSAPVRKALLANEVTWAAASYRPRCHYGTEHVSAVGDAAGTVHPLTAGGLTLGLLDVATVASLPFHDWREQRLRDTLVPEWLSLALYGVFAGQQAGARQLRDGVFQHWQRSPRIREQTTALLAIEETRPAAFARVFTRIGLGTAAVSLTGQRQPRNAGAVLRTLLPWARWPVAAVLPERLVTQRRRRSTPVAPLNLNIPLKGSQPMPLTNDHRYCLESLQAVSRTFSQPIRMLDEPLQTGVACGYLLCRVADTIEDHPGLEPAQRNRLFPLFLAVLSREISPEVFAAAFPLDDPNDPEVDLATHLPRVLRVLDSIPGAQRDAVLYWVGEMARGMQIYTQRRTDDGGLLTLLTMQDLERYCYFVAGTVGHMLTELFIGSHPHLPESSRQRLTELAESFGMGLQLVNMIKDVADDLERGVVYVPRALCARARLTPAQLLDPALGARAQEALSPMFTLAWTMLDDAVEYTCLLPTEATDQRLFCLLPLLMAGATLSHAQDHPDLLKPGAAVKISRDVVHRIIADAQRLATDNDAIRAQWQTLRHASAQRRAS
ncbi:MAG: FAD-dependent oxidoreductase [Candidatus Dadabacteria bacterium]|nr:MAG: FAD-dependent oxidoreductase [Candidatus Dadabacteria bacterium]